MRGGSQAMIGMRVQTITHYRLLNNLQFFRYFYTMADKVETILMDTMVSNVLLSRY